jgi:hypothetical protein
VGHRACQRAAATAHRQLTMPTSAMAATSYLSRVGRRPGCAARMPRGSGCSQPHDGEAKRRLPYDRKNLHGSPRGRGRTPPAQLPSLDIEGLLLSSGV